MILWSVKVDLDSVDYAVKKITIERVSEHVSYVNKMLIKYIPVK